MMDPLIVRGAGVVPAVMTAIENPSMERRRVAIRFLGNGRYAEALPLLLRLFSQPDEPDKDEILVSIYRIDQNVGSTLAEGTATTDPALSSAKRDILTHAPYLATRRSYFQAWLGMHDLESD
jgi:hypothetical protein